MWKLFRGRGGEGETMNRDEIGSLGLSVLQSQLQLKKVESEEMRPVKRNGQNK